MLMMREHIIYPAAIDHLTATRAAVSLLLRLPNDGLGL